MLSRACTTIRVIHPLRLDCVLSIPFIWPGFRLATAHTSACPLKAPAGGYETVPDKRYVVVHPNSLHKSNLEEAIKLVETATGTEWVASICAHDSQQLPGGLPQPDI
jgi:hypothetical protein